MGGFPFGFPLKPLEMGVFDKVVANSPPTLDALKGKSHRKSAVQSKFTTLFGGCLKEKPHVPMQRHVPNLLKVFLGG